MLWLPALPLSLWLLLKQQKYHRKSGSKVHMARPLPSSSRRASQAPVTVSSTPSALEGQTGATDRRSLFSAAPSLAKEARQTAEGKAETLAELRWVFHFLMQRGFHGGREPGERTAELPTQLPPRRRFPVILVSLPEPKACQGSLSTHLFFPVQCKCYSCILLFQKLECKLQKLSF